MHIDSELAERTKEKGCPHCHSALHFARYDRKGRTGGSPAPEGWARFHGLCCSREGCRKRARPPSVRFAGRSPLAPVLVLLAHLLRARGSKRRVSQIRAALSVSERTVRRWLSFWDKAHATSRWWREVASLHALSGKTIASLNGDVFQVDWLKNAVVLCISLWGEVPFGVGPEPPAEDA